MPTDGSLCWLPPQALNYLFLSPYGPRVSKVDCCCSSPCVYNSFSITEFPPNNKRNQESLEIHTTSNRSRREADVWFFAGSRLEGLKRSMPSPITNLKPKLSSNISADLERRRSRLSALGQIFSLDTSP